ncbi:uncharacterized protein LOC121393546 [Xenopus laevis]|uniref:Uncharacterized protein LOC121393546 n=1 Tax=Xenopus laevis TaxID=8355 RepID=A0A8J1KLV5_XENLA|nr:uncharacterized protein LOC121393546 [Xenopus laevis]
MNLRNYFIWIIIFGLIMICKTTSEDTQEYEANDESAYLDEDANVDDEDAYLHYPEPESEKTAETFTIQPTIQWTSAGNETETENDNQYDIPVIVTGCILVIPVIGAIAWLVYAKIIKKKQPVNDVENPLETAQPEKDSPILESSDSFFRCLYKKIKEKITKKKPVTDVENPPEIAPSKQQFIEAKRPVFEKPKEKKKKKTVTVAGREKPLMTIRPQQISATDESPVRSVVKKIKRKKKKTINKAESLPAAAAESPDRGKLSEITENSEVPIDISLPEPESDTFDVFSYMESILSSHKTPKNQKRKKVQRYAMFEEIMNNEENAEGLTQQLIALQNKSPTLKVLVRYEPIDDSKEEDATSLKSEMETSTIQLQTSEPREPESLVQYEPIEDSKEEDAKSLQSEMETTTIQLQTSEQRKPESEVQILRIEPPNEDGELPLQIVQESIPVPQQPSEHSEDVVKKSESTVKEDLFFFFLLSCANMLQTNSSELAAYVKQPSEPE